MKITCKSSQKILHSTTPEPVYYSAVWGIPLKIHVCLHERTCSGWMRDHHGTQCLHGAHGTQWAWWIPGCTHDGHGTCVKIEGCMPGIMEDDRGTFLRSKRHSLELFLTALILPDANKCRYFFVCQHWR